MPIVPDTKDWTWVLERRCPECGFDASTLAAPDVVALLRENASAWRPALDAIAEPTRRPSEDRWSPLEYACHVRDVFRLYDARLALMLSEDGPTFPNWDQDLTAVEHDYNAQPVAAVVAQIEAAGTALAARFEGVTDAQWHRTGMRSDGAHFSVDTFARYMIHDPIHHLDDIGGSPRSSAQGG